MINILILKIKNQHVVHFVDQLDINTISCCMNGGCMLLLLPWTIIIDILMSFIAIFMYLP